MSALALKYEDQQTYDGQCGYVCSNENVEDWRSLVKGKRIHRAAGIASGGEVGFFALLPTVRDELVLVDHSYASLAYAMQKYLIIKHRGWKEAQRLLARGSTDEVSTVLTEIREEIPKKVLGAADSLDYPRERYDYATHSYVKAEPTSSRVARSAGKGNLGRIWEDVPEHVGYRITRKLDKITFVHGDYRRLKGPFDLFYVSNAWEAGNGNRGANPGVADIDNLVRPGGYVLIAGRSPYPEYNTRVKTTAETEGTRVTGIPPSWTTISQEKIVAKGGYGMTWQYELYQTGKAE